MANVSFYRQTTGSTATGAITFDTTNKYIYLGDGSTAHKFDCNNTNTDTKNTAGSSNTSSKIYLIGATSQATNPITYSHDTAYVGADGYLYSGGNRCQSTWVQLNSSTGVTLSSFVANSTYSRAKKIFVGIKEAPASILFPDGAVSSSTIYHAYFYLEAALPGDIWYTNNGAGWNGPVIWNIGDNVCFSYRFYIPKSSSNNIANYNYTITEGSTVTCDRKTKTVNFSSAASYIYVYAVQY